MSPASPQTSSRALFLTRCSFLLLATGLLVSSCSTERSPGTAQGVEMGIEQEPFGVHLYTLTNTNGLEAKITNFGGIVTSLRVPDRDGRFESVVLGFSSLA